MTHHTPNTESNGNTVEVEAKSIELEGTCRDEVLTGGVCIESALNNSQRVDFVL